MIWQNSITRHTKIGQGVTHIIGVSMIEFMTGMVDKMPGDSVVKKDEHKRQ